MAFCELMRLDLRVCTLKQLISAQKVHVGGWFTWVALSVIKQVGK